MCPESPDKPDLRLFGGIDIGGTKILAVVADERGVVLAKSKKKVKDKAFRPVCARAAETLREALEAAGLPPERLAAVGATAPAPMLPDGTVIAAPNLGWKNDPLTRALEKDLGLPVYGQNDCNAGTYGEYVFGAGRGARALVGLFMGTGLGGGFLYRGELVDGERHNAAEMGHMIVAAGGRLCGCGRQGCLEAYTSKAGMGRRIAYEIHCLGRKSMLAERVENGQYGSVKSSLLAEAWAGGDALAVEVLREAAHFMGLGIANFAAVLGPDVVVLGGGVLEALGKPLLPLIQESFRRHSWPESMHKDVRVVLSGLGDYAVAVGAVAWARDRMDAGAGA